ncbi:MAG TPA: hypothetical protein ENI69_00390 [Rhodospirillales bacterium]|nr:hypothetical protein [Rhodospirillales bacterium]
MNIERIIVASHATPGALAAEQAALKLARENGAVLHQLLVVPDFWKGMMGDDWLNNAVTQYRFGKYVEDQLARETAVEIDRLAKLAELQETAFSNDIVLGKPDQCLINACASVRFDLAVIGSPRPRGAPGYRSRMKLDPLVRALKTRLLIIPHPDT